MDEFLDPQTCFGAKLVDGLLDVVKLVVDVSDHLSVAVCWF